MNYNRKYKIGLFFMLWCVIFSRDFPSIAGIPRDEPTVELVPFDTLRERTKDIQLSQIERITFEGDQFEGFLGEDGWGPVVVTDRHMIELFLCSVQQATTFTLPIGNKTQQMNFYFKPDIHNVRPEPIYLYLSAIDPYCLGPLFNKALDEFSSFSARETRREIKSVASQVRSMRLYMPGKNRRWKSVRGKANIRRLLGALETVTSDAFAYRSRSRPVYFELELASGIKRRIRLRPDSDGLDPEVTHHHALPIVLLKEL